MTFRVARHTVDIKKLSNFYTSILGLKILGSFQGHNNYDGVFLGLENLSWHLEFTKSNEPPNHTPDEDDILVFYPNTAESYEHIILKVKSNNIPLLTAKNPYWKDNGVLFKDPDGFHIIVSPLKIT